MALPTLTVPLYPDVPLALGVPAVRRDPLGLATAVSNAISGALLGGDGPSISSQTASAPQWGIFDKDGKDALNADSFVKWEYAKDYRISDFPVEGGTFESFNKVETPFEGRITVTKGGADGDRTAFFAALDAAVLSVDAYSVVTPEITYESANVTHYDYSRADHQGATLIRAEIHVEQIRVGTAPAYSNTAAPSGADAKNGGTVQPTTPTAPQAASTAGGGT